MPDPPILYQNRDPGPMPGYHADMSEEGFGLIKVARSLVIPADSPAIEPSAGRLSIGEDARGERVPEGDFFGVNPAQRLDAGLSFGG